MPIIEGQVIFENVNFSYEKDQPVLRDITFQAEPGTVIALVGSSGSGKSTLASLAASFLTPDNGKILIDGQDLANIKLSTYRTQLGLVLQDDFLFEGTIRENLLFAKPNASDAAVAQAAEQAHVKDFTKDFPDGLDTLIGERGVKLSGGQRQRVTIARAILSDPRILLLDEATSSLDTESEYLIQQSLSHLLENRTTFVIAHRLSTIQRADLILVIENGKIVERGNHEDLIHRKGRYHELYTIQARI
jgi:subfamily B ATP-binding cassette protein MsbA